MCYKHCSLAHNHSTKELEAYKPATSTPSGLCHCSSQVVHWSGLCLWAFVHGLFHILAWRPFYLVMANTRDSSWSVGIQSQQDGYVELLQWIPAPLIQHGLSWILMCLLSSPNPLCKCLGWAVGCGQVELVIDCLPPSPLPFFSLAPRSPHHSPTHLLLKSLDLCWIIKWCFLLTLTRAPIPLEKDADELHEVYFNRAGTYCPNHWLL